MDLESSLIWLDARLDTALGGLSSGVVLVVMSLVSALFFVAWVRTARRVRHFMSSIARLDLDLAIAREALALEVSSRTGEEIAPLIEQPSVGVRAPSRARLRLLPNDKFGGD
jgi:hypothetical protein